MQDHVFRDAARSGDHAVHDARMVRVTADALCEFGPIQLKDF